MKEKWTFDRTLERKKYLYMPLFSEPVDGGYRVLFSVIQRQM